MEISSGIGIGCAGSDRSCTRARGVIREKSCFDGKAICEDHIPRHLADLRTYACHLD